MTLPMIIALAVTVLMIILIMVDKLPFGAPPLLALLLLVVFGVTDIKTAFGGFANPTIVMLASFMAIIAALQKTSFIVKFKQTMFNMASKGGFKAYVLLILIVMLGCSLFGTGSTAYYVLVIGLLSTLPYSKQLPPSRVLMPAGFAANHPLLPFNTALQYGIVIAVLQSAGVAALLHDGAMLAQRRAVNVRVVAQQMHPVLALKVVAGQLHGGDQLYPVLPGVGIGVLGAEQGVVVRKGDGVQPGAGGDGCQPLNGHSTVGAGGMDMQVTGHSGLLP